MNLNEIGFNKAGPDTSALQSLKILVDQCTFRKSIQEIHDYRPIYHLFSGILLIYKYQK